MLSRTLITAFPCRLTLSNWHNGTLTTSIRWCILPRDNVRRESSVAGAIQGMCVVERAQRLPGACATSPLATRFLRESARPRASSARNNLHNAYRRPGFYFRRGNHWNWILWCTDSITVIRAESQSRTVLGARCSARRRCGPRAPGEWRARCGAALGCATLESKSERRGARRHISPTFAAVIHSSFGVKVASRKSRATRSALLPFRSRSAAAAQPLEVT